jgi:hypothetical protein
MVKLIPDEMAEEFGTVAPFDEIGPKVKGRRGGMGGPSRSVSTRCAFLPNAPKTSATHIRGRRSGADRTTASACVVPTCR